MFLYQKPLKVLKGLLFLHENIHRVFFFIYLFVFFYLGFTALSRIFHLYETIVHQRWAKTGEPGKKPPDLW